MKYLIFIISLVISNLSYSYENNQLLLHNPAKKINFFDLETLDGKKVEIAVKKIIEGKTGTNEESLSNPETLSQFRNIPELLN